MPKKVSKKEHDKKKKKKKKKDNRGVMVESVLEPSIALTTQTALTAFAKEMDKQVRNEIMQSVAAKQLLPMLRQRDGVLEIKDFDRLVQGKIQALPLVAHVVRHAKMDLRQVDGRYDGLELGDFASRAFRLQSLEVIGGPSNVWATLFEGCCGAGRNNQGNKNSFGGLRRLTLTRVCFRQGGRYEAPLLKALKSMLTLSSLAELRIVDCSPAAVKMIVQGFLICQGKNENLRILSLDCQHDKNSAKALGQWIGGLTHLESLENVRAHAILLPHLPKEMEHLARLKLSDRSEISWQAMANFAEMLHNYQNLREFEFHLDNTTVGLTGVALGNFALQFSLFEKLTTNMWENDLRMVLGCNRQLRQLCCPSHLWMYMVWLPYLTSLDIRALSDLEDILRLLEHNQTITELKLQSFSSFAAKIDNQWRKTLVHNKTIKHLTLSMIANDDLVVVLADLLHDDACSLESLALKGLDCDASAILRALQQNTKLKSLSLQYERGTFPEATWVSMVASLPHWKHLQKLEVNLSGNITYKCDDFVASLLKNASLKSIRLLHDKDNEYQNQCDYICRQLGRRNQIRQMIRQGQMPITLWPRLLDCLGPNPSALYVVSNLFVYLIPGACTTIAGKRKRREHERRRIAFSRRYERNGLRLW